MSEGGGLQQISKCMPAPHERCTCGLLQQAACYGALQRYSLAPYPLRRVLLRWGCGAVRLLHSVPLGHMLGKGRGILALAGSCKVQLQHTAL